MRELLKEARDALDNLNSEYGRSNGGRLSEPDALIRRIDSALSAPDEGKKEIYTDDFSQIVSECRSHLNGIITPRTTKSEKAHFGWIALEKLRIIENLWHGIKDAGPEAAALIEPSVPREVLEELFMAAYSYGLGKETRSKWTCIEDIADKHGVKVR